MGAEYSVFMMATSIDYVDDMEGAIDRLSGDGGMLHSEEVKEALAQWTCEIRLPKGWVLVGMCRSGAPETTVYGLVDVSGLKTPPQETGLSQAANAEAEDSHPFESEFEDGRDDGRCTRFYPSLEGTDREAV